MKLLSIPSKTERRAESQALHTIGLGLILGQLLLTHPPLLEQGGNGEQINVGLPSTQLKDGKIEVNFYNHESKEARTIPVNPFAASKANKAAREAFFERKDAEREQGKSLGAKAASARGASEKLDGQSQAAPAKDNLEH